MWVSANRHTQEYTHTERLNATTTHSGAKTNRVNGVLDSLHDLGAVSAGLVSDVSQVGDNFLGGMQELRNVRSDTGCGECRFSDEHESSLSSTHHIDGGDDLLSEKQVLLGGFVLLGGSSNQKRSIRSVQGGADADDGLLQLVLLGLR